MTNIHSYYGVGLRLRIMPDRSLRYWYEIGEGSSCEFSMLCEVGAPWQARFKRMVDKLGLDVEQGVDLDHDPWVADIVTNAVLP